MPSSAMHNYIGITRSQKHCTEVKLLLERSTILLQSHHARQEKLLECLIFCNTGRVNFLLQTLHLFMANPT